MQLIFFSFTVHRKQCPFSGSRGADPQLKRTLHLQHLQECLPILVWKRQAALLLPAVHRHRQTEVRILGLKFYNHGAFGGWRFHDLSAFWFFGQVRLQEKLYKKFAQWILSMLCQLSHYWALSVKKSITGFNHKLCLSVLDLVKF